MSPFSSSHSLIGGQEKNKKRNKRGKKLRKKEVFYKICFYSVSLSNINDFRLEFKSF